jgi:hypothetical protein
MQSAGFQRQGFGVLPGLLASSDLQRARSCAAAILEQPIPDGCARLHNTLVPLRCNDELVLGALCSQRVVGAVAARLLHGTHTNELPRRRSCLILNFAPAWAELPDEIKAHLIRHPAQPSAHEHPPADIRVLLPAFDGEPRDLPLARDAPARLAIT